MLNFRYFFLFEFHSSSLASMDKVTIRPSLSKVAK